MEDEGSGQFGRPESRARNGADAVAPPRPPLAAGVASVAVNLLALALPLAMLQVFDRVIPYAALDTLLLLVIGLFVTIALDLALKAARAVILGASAEAFERRILAAVTRRALSAEPDAFGEEPALARFERFGAAAQLRDFAGGEGRLLGIDLAFVAVFTATIWLIGGWLVLVPLSALAIMFGVSLLFRRAQSGLFERRRAVDARRFAFLGELLERIATVKAHRMEAPLLRRYEVLQEQAAEASRSLVFVANLSQSFGAVFGQATTAAMALVGGWLVIRGDLGIAALAACTLLNGRAVQPMMKLNGVWSQAEGVAAAQRKLAALADLPALAAPGAVPAQALRGEVEARGLARRNPGRSEPIFEPIDFRAPAGGRLIVTGGDGAGKTTLLRMLLGEVAPSGGAALIDGRPAAEWRGARGRGGVAYLDQRPVVFHGSILENIAPSGRADDIADGLAAAAALGLDEEIRRLPQGYETRLGRAGGAASYSFLQRVALARALALRPRILLFNEANTAMDRPSDERARAALAALEGETTLIVVTRRPGWIALSDNVVTLAAPSRAAPAAGPETLALSWAQMVAPGRAAPPPYRLTRAELVKEGRAAQPAESRPAARPGLRRRRPARAPDAIAG